MTNNLQLSPDFTIERGRTARNIVTVTAPAPQGFNLIPAVAPFIAAILAAGAPERPPPRRRVLDAIRLTVDGTSVPKPGEPPCHKGE
jgi:hypothetical protein